MRYMLDTNICISLIRRRPQSVLKHLKRALPRGVCLSSVTVAELEYGVQKSAHVEQNALSLLQFLVGFEAAAFDDAAARHYGEIRAALEGRGTPIGSMDLPIAAHARSMGVTLVTNNEREFRRVEGLRVENWASGGLVPGANTVGS